MKINLMNRGTIGTTEIVAIAIAILMVAIILPIGLEQMGVAVGGTVENENISRAENWGPSKTVFIVLMATVVPILAVLGIAMKFL